MRAVDKLPPTPIGRVGRFDLLGRLATGGMAEIFLARETGPSGAKRHLVVKRILPHIASDPAVRAMFAQEARLCLQLSHPCIGTIHEFGEDGGTFFLAMEWVAGVTAASLVKRAAAHGGLPVAMAAKIVADVAGALHHAHTALDVDGQPLGVIHRDVTPDNIMVSYDGVVKLIDFGVAKAATQLKQTQTGVLKGKFAYMSPEQYRGETLDGRSDVFSLGATLYELLTGVSPFERASEFETVAAIVIGAEIRPLRDLRPEVPASLAAIVDRALARDRDERFSTADDMRTSLEAFLREGKHVVIDSMIAEYVRRLFRAEYAAGPVLERVALQGVPQAKNDVAWHEEVAALDEAEATFARRSERRGRAMVVLIVIVVVAVAAAYAYVLAGTREAGGDGAFGQAP